MKSSSFCDNTVIAVPFTSKVDFIVFLINPPLCGKLVQGNIVLDVFRDKCAVLRRYSAEVSGGKDRVGSQVGKVFALDDMAHLLADVASLSAIRFQVISYASL